MNGFKDSYVGRLRQFVGSQLLLVPGARIVVENADGEILLEMRSDFRVWGLPGGNAEPGEDLVSVVEREVFEETGLTIANAKPFGFGCNPNLETVQFPNGDRCQFYVLNFYTGSYTGNLTMQDGESLALDWFSLDSLPEMLPNMFESIQAYRKYLATGDFQLF